MELSDYFGRLPTVGFAETRRIIPGSAAERAVIQTINSSEDHVIFDPREQLVFGVFEDQQGNKYLVHAESERPYGGIPKATPFDQIRKYEPVNKE